MQSSSCISHTSPKSPGSSDRPRHRACFRGLRAGSLRFRFCPTEMLLPIASELMRRVLVEARARVVGLSGGGGSTSPDRKTRAGDEADTSKSSAKLAVLERAGDAPDAACGPPAPRLVEGDRCARRRSRNEGIRGWKERPAARSAAPGQSTTSAAL